MLTRFVLHGSCSTQRLFWQPMFYTRRLPTGSLVGM